MQCKNYCEDERVISAFLTNFRMVDVIRETGLSKKTCYKIKNDPQFQKILQERKDAILQEAVSKIRGFLVRDVEILQKIIEDPETSAQTKINGIQLMFNQFSTLNTNVDLARRLDALQEASGAVSATFSGVCQ